MCARPLSQFLSILTVRTNVRGSHKSWKCRRRELTCTTGTWSPVSSDNESFAPYDMAVIAQHAIESRVCSAQYPRCADQRPGFHISKKAEKCSSYRKNNFWRVKQQKLIRNRAQCKSRTQFLYHIISYVKNNSEFYTHFLLLNFMFTFLSHQTESLTLGLTEGLTSRTLSHQIQTESS